uniref:Uncharacterized protein n=1 Tax=Glossina palpalis gambiensis TaxID=67801 RepID=A0A1B0BUD8_9MUSC
IFKNALKIIIITLRKWFASLELHFRSHVLILLKNFPTKGVFKVGGDINDRFLSLIKFFKSQSHQWRNVFELILDLYSLKTSTGCYPVNSSSFTKLQIILNERLNVYTGITLMIYAIPAVLDKFYVPLIDLILRHLLHRYVKCQSSIYQSSKHISIYVLCVEFKYFKRICRYKHESIYVYIERLTKLNGSEILKMKDIEIN